MANFLTQILGDRSRSQHRPLTQALLFDGINDYLMMEGTSGIAKDIYDNFNFTNKWAVSFWINPLTNVGGRYLMWQWVRTTRTFAQGIWNTSPNFDIVYGGQSSVGGTTGFQRVPSTGGAQQNNFKSYTFNKRNTFIHHLVTYDNTLALADRLQIFINGNRNFISASAVPNLTGTITSLNYIFSIGADSYNTAAFSFTPMRLTEYMLIRDYIPTSTEIRSIYNLGANGYSANILSNRFLHLKLSSSSEFDVNAGQLRALDSSGNNRHINVFGMGTTPNLINVY